MRYLFLILSIFFASCLKSQDVKSISTSELKQLLSKEKIQLIDVRTPDEISQGFIKSAKFANFFDTDFYQNASAQLDKSKPVYLYCRSSNRSSKAAAILKEKGFKVYFLEGGYTQWKFNN